MYCALMVRARPDSASPALAVAVAPAPLSFSAIVSLALN